MTSAEPPQPTRRAPSREWPHAALYQEVKAAVLALPTYFETETSIAGIAATDIHTLSAVLGATIEEQVVSTLNQRMRRVWDPQGKYPTYSFIRQPQTFPDVLLRRPEAEEKPLLGIELKGWYLLAKEGEPNFRFQVTPAACADADLLVVVPWVLSQVISGRPIVFAPFIESARYAAEYRNYWWEHRRKAKGEKAITIARGVQPYPTKSDAIADRPLSDGGGNFGRLARTQLLDEYTKLTKTHPLCGIRIEYWLRFFKAFQETRTDDEIRDVLDDLARRVKDATEAEPKPVVEAVSRILGELHKLLDLEPTDDDEA